MSWINIKQAYPAKSKSAGIQDDDEIEIDDGDDEVELEPLRIQNTRLADLQRQAGAAKGKERERLIEKATLFADRLVDKRLKGRQCSGYEVSKDGVINIHG